MEEQLEWEAVTADAVLFMDASMVSSRDLAARLGTERRVEMQRDG